MTTLTKRVQVLFPEPLWQNLLYQAQLRNRSVGALIREAVEQVYFVDETQKTARSRIIDEIAAMELPVADWEQMERESTARGYFDE
ncbi:MAG: hypothetical protein NT075_04545 [Chloroflexi bacterium]|nr:hypothetical protein [Chloroflexota bacterium]